VEPCFRVNLVIVQQCDLSEQGHTRRAEVRISFDNDNDANRLSVLPVGLLS
jgi:hypothetical protein